MAIKKVIISRGAQKELKKMPVHIVRKLLTWVDAVELEGLEEVRNCRGYHDEPLSGQRRGQHSIRLSRSYRAIYTIDNRRQEIFVNIEGISKHDY